MNERQKQLIVDLAEQVMGWELVSDQKGSMEVHRIQRPGYLEGCSYLLLHSRGSGYVELHEGWNPLTRLADAALLAEKLKERNWNLYLINYAYDRCYAYIGPRAPVDTDYVQANGLNAVPESIAYAAFEAIRREQPAGPVKSIGQIAYESATRHLAFLAPRPRTPRMGRKTGGREERMESDCSRCLGATESSRMNNLSSEYKPVPVEAAQQISGAYTKDIVVIMAYDRVHAQIHITTFGNSPEDKLEAARLGDALPNMLGAAVKESKWYEDFRAVEAAQYKAQIDQLVAASGIHVGIIAERKRQDAQWGGPQHDDSHDPMEWMDFIGHQLEKFARTAIVRGEEYFSTPDCRQRFEKIGALALAALESFDRKEKNATARGAE